MLTWRQQIHLHVVGHPHRTRGISTVNACLAFCFWIFLAYIYVPNNGFIMTFFCIYMILFDHTALCTLTFPLSPFFS